jgi:hypothetical protein
MKMYVGFDMTKEYVYVARTITDQVREWLDAFPGKAGYCLGGNGVYFEHPEDATYFTLLWA